MKEQYVLNQTDKKIISNAFLNRDYWTLPSAIDLPALIENHKPRFDYKIENFYYILEALCDKMDYQSLEEYNYWVNLDVFSKPLNIRNSKKYISYLHHYGIIDIDFRISDLETIANYRISLKYYSGQPVRIPFISDPYIKRKFRELKLEQEECVNIIIEGNILSPWFNERFELDEFGALYEIELLYPKYSKYTLLKNMRFKALRAVSQLGSGCWYNMKPTTSIWKYSSELITNSTIRI